MVKLPDFITDKTLEAIDRCIEAAQENRPQNGRLYMSQIGRPCEREIWYQVNDYPKYRFDAHTLKLFEDGNTEEARMEKRLRMLPFIELHTLDTDGKQYKFSDFDDRLSGRIDGAILGLLEAPRTWHAWEHKSSAKLNDMIKAKEKYGEKKALENWNYPYYATAVLYMDYGGFSRHFMTVSSPGGRQYTSTRTEPNPLLATNLKAKARRILDAKVPPIRISERKEFFQCKSCSYKDVCWQ